MGAPDLAEPEHHPLPDLIDTFEQAAIAAGKEILAVRAAGAQVSIKSDSSPVTQADRVAETLILARLAAQFPDVPVVGIAPPGRDESAKFVTGSSMMAKLPA